MAPSSDDFRCTTKNGWRCFLVPKFHGLKGLMMMMIWKYITCQHSFWHQFCNNFAFQLTSAIAPQSLPTRVFSVMLIFYKWYHPRDIPKDIAEICSEWQTDQHSTFLIQFHRGFRCSPTWKLASKTPRFSGTHRHQDDMEGWSWFTSCSNAKLPTDPTVK